MTDREQFEAWLTEQITDSGQTIADLLASMSSVSAARAGWQAARASSASEARAPAHDPYFLGLTPGYVRNAKGELMEADHEGVRAAPAQPTLSMSMFATKADYKAAIDLDMRCDCCGRRLGEAPAQPVSSLAELYKRDIGQSPEGSALASRIDVDMLRDVPAQPADEVVGDILGGSNRMFQPKLAQPAERVLLRRGTNLGALGVGTGPWMEISATIPKDTGEYAWATIERINQPDDML